MRRITTLLAATVLISVALPSAKAAALDQRRDDGGGHSGYSLSLRIDRVKASTGQVKFTVTPQGFTYVKVPDDGAPNVSGQGHAHLYAKDTATGKVRYIGWTGNGLTDWSDAGRLAAGKTYRVYAIFSENDHKERPGIRSRAVTVTIP